MKNYEIALSVIIPCYNQGEFILEAISSVRECQDEIYEIIIVNDGSTEASTLKVLSYLKDNGYHVINQTNQGLAAARNNGIKAAKGAYILPLDADNKIRSAYITKAVEILDKHPEVGVVYGNAEFFGEKTGIHVVPDFNINLILLGNYIDACAVFRKIVWKECGGYDTKIPDKLGYEDWDFWLGAAEKGWKFYHINEVLFDYRIRSNSMVSACNIPENRQQLLRYICTKHIGIYSTNFANIWAERECVYLTERAHSENLQLQLQQLRAELEKARSHQILREGELNAELKRKQERLEELLQQAQQNEAQLQTLRTKLTSEQAQQQQMQIQLQQKTAELAEIQAQLQETQARLRQVEAELLNERSELEQSRARLAAMQTSKFWKMRTQWFKLKKALGLGADDCPAETVAVEKPQVSEPPAESTPEINQPIPEKKPWDIIYHQWLSQNLPREADLKKLAETVEIFPYKPVISVIMPVYNTPARYLIEALESVRNQIYPYWELCIADDASTEPHVKEILKDYAAKDARIKVVFRKENGHISRASNSAIEIATGEFISLLDHDDLLTPDALYEVALLLNRHPEADMIYSDEDKIEEDNNLTAPFFKPDWCPDSFLSRMYSGHLGTYRRAIASEIGGFRVGYEGSQDYDFVLRFTEKTDKIFHIPKILYHWRIHPVSAASGTQAKPYAYEAAKKALTEALERRGEKGVVTDVPIYWGHYVIRYEIKEYKKVSIIIPTRDLSDILNACLESIFTKSQYPNYEVILIDNGSKEEATKQVIADWKAKEPDRFHCYPLDIPFNYSKINNYAVSKAQGDYLLFLNNDTEVITPDWIEGMVEQAQRAGIGAVGALLLYPDNTIQHAGVILGLGGIAAHSHQYLPSTSPGYFGHVISISNVSAVTAACLMCRREVFESVGGFDEELAWAYNDVDFCLKILAKGYRNIYLPHVVLYHHESKSRGYEDTPEKLERLAKEAALVKSRWQKLIDNDPCYNPNLTRSRADYSLRIAE